MYVCDTCDRCDTFRRQDTFFSLISVPNLLSFLSIELLLSHATPVSLSYSCSGMRSIHVATASASAQGSTLIADETGSLMI